MRSVYILLKDLIFSKGPKCSSQFMHTDCAHACVAHKFHTLDLFLLVHMASFPMVTGVLIAY